MAHPGSGSCPPSRPKPRHERAHLLSAQDDLGMHPPARQLRPCPPTRRDRFSAPYGFNRTIAPRPRSVRATTSGAAPMPRRGPRAPPWRETTQTRAGEVTRGPVCRPRSSRSRRRRLPAERGTPDRVIAAGQRATGRRGVTEPLFGPTTSATARCAGRRRERSEDRQRVERRPGAADDP